MDSEEKLKRKIKDLEARIVRERQLYYRKGWRDGWSGAEEFHKEKLKKQIEV